MGKNLALTNGIKVFVARIHHEPVVYRHWLSEQYLHYPCPPARVCEVLPVAIEIRDVTLGRDPRMYERQPDKGFMIGRCFRLIVLASLKSESHNAPIIKILKHRS